MGTITDQVGRALLRLLANSRLPSELIQIWRLLAPVGLVVQSGEDNAQYSQIAQVRGYLGNYNASTNVVTLGDGSTTQLPNDLDAVAGEWVKVSVAGTRNLGSGNITLGVGDRLRHDGEVWYKDSSVSPLIIPENGELIIKRDGKLGEYLQIGDRVAFKKVQDGLVTKTIIGHKYVGGDPLLYSSYANPGLDLIEP